MFAEINARLPSVAHSLYQYLKFSEGATPEGSFRDDLATSSLPLASHRAPALSRRLFSVRPLLVCAVEAFSAQQHQRVDTAGFNLALDIR